MALLLLRMPLESSTPWDIQLLPLPLVFPKGVFSNYWTESVTQTLDFAFPFAGTNWTSLFVNVQGTLSFEKPETILVTERYAWPSGTMRSVAAAIDGRAAIGTEKTIAVLWAIYASAKKKNGLANPASTVYVNSTATALTVTWDVARVQPGSSFYQPLGRNLFQVKLLPSGAIEMAYGEIAERDGIVGVFSGLPDESRRLDYVEDPAITSGNNIDSPVNMRSLEVIEQGSVIRFRFDMAQPIPLTVNSPDWLAYRIFLNVNGQECELWLEVRMRQSARSTCTDTPDTVSYVSEDGTLDLFLSKTALGGGATFSWRAEAVRWQRTVSGEIKAVEFDQIAFSSPRSVSMLEIDIADFSNPAATLQSNSYEVFHYPSVPKNPAPLLKAIYTQYPQQDDFAVVFTDFRMDDLYGHGGSYKVNHEIAGIGVTPVNRGDQFGSKKLLTTMAPTFVGQPRFAEAVRANKVTYNGYPYAVGWIAHEATHHWLAYMSFRDSSTGAFRSLLADDGCECHWSDRLQMTPLIPVAPFYSNTLYSENSMNSMGGVIWKEKAPGVFVQEMSPFGVPQGLSALDLYAMGLLPSDEVPDSFILNNITVINDNGGFSAAKTRVQIEDIITAMGSRKTSSKTDPRTFTFSFYLITEPGQPVKPDMLRRAQGISGAVVKYFAIATGGRMQTSFEPHTNLPVAHYDVLEATVITSTEGTFRGKDSGNAQLLFSIVGSQRQGTVELLDPTTGRFRYTPSPGAHGYDQILFKVTNKDGDSNIASVTIFLQGSHAFLPMLRR